MADATNGQRQERLKWLFPEGDAVGWGQDADGGPLHRLLALLATVAHAQLVHERVIDEQGAAAFRAMLRQPSLGSSAQFLASLLGARKLQAADLLGIVPADTSRSRSLTADLRDLLRAARLDSEKQREPKDPARIDEPPTAAELLREFLLANLEGEVVVAAASTGPLAPSAAARPAPAPEAGPTAFFVRSDGSRIPLHPFVIADASSGKGHLWLLWDLEGGALRWRRSDGLLVEARPSFFLADFFMDFMLRMGAHGEVREWLRGMAAEDRGQLDRRNILYAGACHAGAVALRGREHAQGIVELEKAVKLRPDLLLPHLWLAQGHVSLKQFDQALDILKRHAVLFNRSDRVFELMGDCHRQKRELSTALRLYDKAASLNPFNTQVERKRDLIRDEVRKEREGAQASAAAGQPAPPPGVRLEDFLVDMTLEAEIGLYSGTVGREEELRQLVEVLSCRDKRNALLLGEPGVGKTALVEDFVLRLVQRRLPRRFHGKKVYLMTVATLLAGAKFRGQFEERVLDLVKLLKTQDCIVFIDNFHNVVNAGLTRGGTLDTSAILKPFLVKGDLQVIGATTPEEFRQNIERDLSLLRCFQLLSIDEPSLDQAVEMVLHVKARYEQHHGAVLTADLVRATMPVIDACVRERMLPDKALDVLDRACAVAGIRRAAERLAAERASAASDGGPGREAESDSEQAASEAPQELTREDVLLVLSEISRIPVSRLTEDMRARFATMESHLAARVIGQDGAISRVARVLRAARTGLTLDARRPKGVFLFVGPTGVGKTELARALADKVFGSEDRLIRIDMSEYMERINQSRLIGTAPGYVGYNDQNQLTDEVRKNPHSLVLLDEIEKAANEMLHLFLQVFDAGRLTDGKGRTVHFDNTTIVMTSNVGTHLFSQAALGFEDGRGGRRNVAPTELLREVKRHFPPEFLNRIDEIICFNPLGVDDVQRITRQKIGRLTDFLGARGKRLELTPEAENLLAREGYSAEEGARNLERAIRRCLLEPMAERALEPDWEWRSLVRVGLEGDHLSFELGDAEPEAELPAEGEFAREG